MSELNQCPAKPVRFGGVYCLNINLMRQAVPLTVPQDRTEFDR